MMPIAFFACQRSNHCNVGLEVIKHSSQGRHKLRITPTKEIFEVRDLQESTGEQNPTFKS